MSETNGTAEESPVEKKKKAARQRAEDRKSQDRLPGMEPELNPKLEKLSKEYRANRDAWMGLKPDMDKSRQKLEVAMKEAGLDFYETKDGYECDMRAGEPHVTVRKKKKESSVD